MKLPHVSQSEYEQSVFSRFLGLDYSSDAPQEALIDEENLSSRAYPLIAPRMPRQIVRQMTAPQGMIGHEKLFFIDDGRMYYAGVQVQSAPLSQGKKTLAKMGAYIAIFPDKILFNTQTLETEPMENIVQTQSEATVTLCADEAGGAFSQIPTVSQSAPQDNADGALWIDSSVVPHILKKWSAQGGMWFPIDQTHVKIACAGIGAGFCRDDGVTIEGLGALDGDYYLEGCGNDFLVIGALIDAPYQTQGTVRVLRKVPDMDYVLEFENRLWGCSSADHALYACKLGDAKNWNCFMGLASDSYAASVGLPGPFTGCAAQLGSVVFFKSDALLRVYGTKPSNFQLSVLYARGASFGSAQSCAVLNETLYYLSEEGPVCCDGAIPQPFSHALSPLRLKKGRAAAYRGCYYLCAEDQNGDHQLFVYDEALQLWRRQDNTNVLFFAVCDERLWYVDQDGMLLCEGGQSPYDFPQTQTEHAVSWRARLNWIGLFDPAQQRVRRIVIRAQLFSGAQLHVYARFDDEETFTHIVSHEKAGICTIAVPVRPRRAARMGLEIRGVGDARIFSVGAIRERGSEKGGMR